MKITQTRLKEIIQEEVAAVAAEGLSPDAMEERTPMMPPRESAIADAVRSIINGLRSGKLSAQGAADRLESEVKSKLYKLGLEEGELEEGMYNKDPRPCADDETYKPPNRNDYRQFGKCVKKDKDSERSERNKRLNRIGYEE